MPSDNLNKQLLKLHKNLNILREREAKYGGNAPLDLLNQIADHQAAIELVSQAQAGQISENELTQQLAPLNLALGNSVQQIFQTIPLPFLIGGLIIGAMIAGSLFLNTSWGQVFFAPVPTATALFTSPAAAGELLILVAEFDSSGEKVVKAHEDIYDKLHTEIKRLGLTDVRVQLASKIINDQEIETWKQVYKPTFIIWGGTDDVRTITKFSITAPASDNLVNIPTKKTLLDLPNFNLFIAYELPEQMAFFAKFTIGQIYFRDNHLPEASRVFASVLQNYSPDIPVETVANAYFYQGFTFQKLNKLNDALTQYQQAIERNPSLYQAYYNRGVAFTDLRLFDEAANDFSKAIELKPDLTLAYFNRANIHRIQGQPEQALQDYNEGLTLSPTNADALLARGEVYKEQGDHTRALADYNRAIELAPDLALAYIFRAQLQKERRAKDKAEEDYQKASTLLDPKQDNDLYIYAQGSLAWLAYERGDYQMAIQANQAALEASQKPTPEQPSFLDLLYIRYNLALALLADGQVTQAKAEYDIALNLTPIPEMLDPVIADVKSLLDTRPNNTDIVEILSYLQTHQTGQPAEE